MDIKLIMPDTCDKQLVKAMLDYNIMYGKVYTDKIKKNFRDNLYSNYSEIFAMVLGLLRFQKRYKEVFGSQPDEVRVSVNGGDVQFVSEVLSNVDKNILVNAEFEYEFLETRNSIYLAKVNLEAQMFRSKTLEDDGEEPSNGKCFTLAKKLSEFCIMNGIPACVSYMEKYHAVLVVDGVCIDGSWMDGCNYNEDEISKSSEARDLDNEDLEWFTIVSVNDYLEFYRENYNN